jgi:hypothetical protein
MQMFPVLRNDAENRGLCSEQAQYPGRKMTSLDPYDVAIDQILEGADGDIRLALRTVLMQNVQLEARLIALSQKSTQAGPEGQDLN